MPNTNSIREETAKVIILERDIFKSFIYVIPLVILSGIGGLLLGGGLGGVLVGLVFGGMLLFFGPLNDLLANERITVNKKSQSVAMRYSEYIDKLPFSNFTKEIPFSNIERIEIERNADPESFKFSWGINIITIQGDSTKIFEASDESYVDIVAWKICEITGKEISYHPKCSY